jgi:hypothetical protein
MFGSGDEIGSYYLKNGFTHAPKAAWEPIKRGAPKVRRFPGGRFPGDQDRPDSPKTLDEIPERQAIAYIRRAVAEEAAQPRAR